MENVDNKKQLILMAYELLSDVTPLKGDCGILCGKACCANLSGDGEQSGMLLLPGEAELIEKEEGFEIKENAGGSYLTCSGNCRRDYRPFSCRIFPFYPKITQYGSVYHIEILPDPRSMNVCPITMFMDKRSANIEFLRLTKRAVRLLMRDEDIKKELISQSDMIGDIAELREKLL